MDVEDSWWVWIVDNGCGGWCIGCELWMKTKKGFEFYNNGHHNWYDGQMALKLAEKGSS